MMCPRPLSNLIDFRLLILLLEMAVFYCFIALEVGIGRILIDWIAQREDLQSVLIQG